MDHLRHHARFYTAALLGLLVWVVLSRRAEPHELLVAGDVFFGTYLLSTTAGAARATAPQLRQRAAYPDEGIILIAVITLTAVGLSLGSVLVLLGLPGRPTPGQLVLVFTSVPLGWLTLHTVAAFHYADRYYARAEPGSAHQPDVGGLAFPETSEPAASDFLYHAFVVGMTAQVSDVQVVSTAMRRLTLAHGIVSFFFNTVILALAVSATAGQG